MGHQSSFEWDDLPYDDEYDDEEGCYERLLRGHLLLR